MKPLNQKERRNAFMKFLGVFLLTVTIVISSAFVAGVKVPNATGSLQDQKCVEAQTLAQHLAALRTSIELLGTQDIALAGESNREKQKSIRSEIRRLETDYQTRLEDIRLLPESALKQDLLTVAEAYLTLRSEEIKAPAPPEPCDCGDIVDGANRNIEKLKDINENAVNDLTKIRDDIGILNFNRNRIKNDIDRVIKKLEKGDFVQEVTE